MTLADERIERLHELAKQATERGEYDQSRHYVRLAQRIAQRERRQLSRTFKRSTCDRCDVYLRAGRNARQRLQDGHIVITCDCGSQSRYPY